MARAAFRDRRAGFRRRRLSLTSLIDVIFLLLLFFMLSSTFARFSEIELVAAGSGPVSDAAPPRLIFLRLDEHRIGLDTRAVTLADLPAALDALVASEAGPVVALIRPGPRVSAQRLADLLVVLRGLAGLQVRLLAPT